MAAAEQPPFLVDIEHMTDGVPVYTRQQVEAEAARIFGKEAVKGIMQLLDQYHPEGPGGERVHMGILKLSEGDVSKLRHYVEQAQKDFRDILYWAEYY